jgi:hypothetical protein
MHYQRHQQRSQVEMPSSPLRSETLRLFRRPASSDKCVHLPRAASSALCAADDCQEVDPQDLQEVGFFE